MVFSTYHLHLLIGRSEEDVSAFVSISVHKHRAHDQNELDDFHETRQREDLLGHTSLPGKEIQMKEELENVDSACSWHEI